jgi:hypothetical protein
MLASE